MKERPILFSTPMVRAILEGRKTQTRRICKPTPAGTMMPHKLLDDRFFKKEHIGKWLWETASGEYLGYCPYGQPGDRLWVRETFLIEHSCHKNFYEYRADYSDTIALDVIWRPSIFMPREACRLMLEVTDVRVERLQDISEEDAIAEGIAMPNYAEEAIRDIHFPEPTEIYMMLWESINGKGSWDKNPWVWVIEFKKIEP